jgi:hypothetical protein
MRFYFFLRPQGTPLASGYQHCSIAIAEGLRELGVPYHSNISYWSEGGRNLFETTPGVSPQDCDVIVSSTDYESFGTVPPELFRAGRKLVFIDASDGWRTRTETDAYRRFDVVLRTHRSSRYRYPHNVHPWAFGLTNRILGACSNPLPYREREARMLVNFRVSHPVRQAASERVLPALAGRFPLDATLDETPAEGTLDRTYWEATGRRHYASFFLRLQRSMACAAFGGYFAPGVFRSTESLAERILYRLTWRAGRRTRTIMQFDNWRFWESMAAGCLTLQVDYKRYGCSLPVQPDSQVHYAGIDFERSEGLHFVLDSDVASLMIVAEAGRNWAVTHYSPAAVARRLLHLLGYES